VKGTQLILPVLERLVDEKVITLDLVTGVPTTDMPQRFADADVVIDQMRVGSYGVAAVEAMASGCVVVGHVSNEVRALITAQSGSELPIVEATVDIIEQVLRDLAEDQSFISRRAHGLEIVQELHDGTYSAKVLREHWIDRNRADDRRAHTDASTR
jgi:glycosyltransferase involved in cell wall biosynthesis